MTSSVYKLYLKVISERDQLRGRKPPVLIKIAPDLTDKDKKDIAEVVLNRQVRLF